MSQSMAAFHPENLEGDSMNGIKEWGGQTVVVVVAAAVFALSFGFGVKPLYPPRPEEEDALLESEETPSSRDFYEWLRLHDPSTGQIPPDIRTRELAFAANLPSRESLPAPSLLRGLGASVTQSISWSRRGPFNVGGRSRALALDVSNPNIILAGGVSGGMWRSTNGGASWVKTTTASQLHSVTCLAQDTRTGHTNVWYYGTGELRGNSAGQGSASFRGDGIFKSFDGGQSWNQLPSTVSGTPQSFDQMFDYVWNIVIDPSSSQDEIYAATIGGINRSTDGGTSWTTVRGGMGANDSRWTDVAITTTGILYATMSEQNINSQAGAASRGLFRSTDGVIWTDITSTTPQWPSSYKRIVIGVAPSNENVVYFLGETPGAGFQTTYAGTAEATSFWKYTYLSGDGSGTGGSWEDRSANLPAYGAPVGSFASQGSYDLVVKVKPDDENTVFIGGTNLYRSTNGFASTASTSWIGGYATANNVSQYSGHHPDQHALVFLPSGGNTLTLYSGHDGGISKTTNNLASTVSWTSLNNGYSTTQFYTVAIDHATSGNAIIIGGMQDNGTWFTNSAVFTVPWTALFSGDGTFCAIADSRSSYYVSSQNGVVYRFLLTDAGGPSESGWYTRVDPTGGASYLFVNPFVLDPTTPTVMYLAAGPSLWRNSNLLAIPMGSQNTTSVNWTNLTGAALSGATISALGTSRNSPSARLYYGSSDGKVYRLDGAVAATTSSAPVDVWTGKGFPAGAYVSCLAVDPANGDRVMAVFSNYSVPSLFLTTDGGSTWSGVEGNLGGSTGPSCRWAVIFPYQGTTTYFVGTSTGLYSTQLLNGASTVWAQEGAATIGNVVVDMLDSRPSDGLVVAATHGQGIFSGTVSSVDVAQEPVPMRTALMQNFPNPFNPSTTIRFTLATAGPVTLKVFATTGQEVATLVDGVRGAGEHRVEWTPGGLASGVYLYRLESHPAGAGSYVESRKLVLLK